MNLHIGPFRGVTPRTHFSQARLGTAKVAQDVNLLHGTLRPWREPLPVALVPGEPKTVQQWGCCWYGWQNCVEVADWVPSCPRFYVTGDQPWPSVELLHEDCTRTVARVGVPPPDLPPSAEPFAAPTWDPVNEPTEARSYIYTYTNALGEEGSPSPPSQEFNVDDGTPVTVTGFVVPDPSWGVTTINIYRQATGFLTGDEKIEHNVTDFFLVGQVPVGTASWIDNTPNVGLGPTLWTRDFLPPPAGLRGICSIDESRTLVGFVGNTLWFSRAGQPWAWPEAQVLTLDDNIVALAAFGATLFVMTDGHPYVVSAVSDCEKGFGCRAVARAPLALPMAACCSSRGVVVTPAGVVYVGVDGLVIGDGKNWRVMTDPWYAFDDWRQLHPENMRLGYHEATLLAVSDMVAFALRVDRSVYSDAATAHLTTISDRPESMVTGRNGELFLHTKGRVSQWNAGSAWRPYLWGSADILTARPTYFTALRVSSDGAVETTLTAEGRSVLHRRSRASLPMRIQHYGRRNRHTVTLRGTEEVWALDLATSERELAYSNGGGDG